MALRTGDIFMEIFKRSKKWKDLQDDELLHLKKVMTEISDDIVSVCEKHNLNYSMAYGTALGAVRHKGFIPWDDDMDFYMPREDYDKFVRIANEELKENYYVRSVSKGDDMAVATCHIRRKNTRYVNYGDMVMLSKEPEEMRGIYVDIFPLENSSNITIIRKIDGIINLGIQFIMSCVVVCDSVKYFQSLGITLTEEEKRILSLKMVLGKFFGIIPLYRWCKFFDRFASKNKNNYSKYVTSYTGYKSLTKSVYLREKVVNTTVGEFEGRLWKLPVDYDYYLKTQYGDYMKMPDKKHQKVHPVFELEFDKRN